MANEGAMFSFEMMNAMPSDWRSDGQTNEMYRCSQLTLSQLQEKVLRSLSKKNEDDNLQVVPQNDIVFEEVSPSPYPREPCAVRCRENRAKEELIENFSVPCSRENTGQVESDQSLQRGPNLRKKPFIAIATCASTEPLRTPTFSFSPLLKSPAHIAAAPVSPLAVMIWSPFGRKPSEDLSMYLPENFTPAATLERLERSITSTVFEFPNVEENQNYDDKEINFELKEKHKDHDMDAEEIDLCSTEDDFLVNTSRNAFANDWNDNNCLAAEVEGDNEFREHSNFAQNEARSKKRKSDESVTNRAGILGFRNKLERKRRSEMNYKYDKLRQKTKSG